MSVRRGASVRLLKYFILLSKKLFQKTSLTVKSTTVKKIARLKTGRFKAEDAAEED
ncbi:MAG: hypothetical protein U0103_14110 [Candidatus Obscuribacterales bacterium]|nr:hypothetical protein [Cyanobacteria bacterium SZAS LIN-5]